MVNWAVSTAVQWIVLLVLAAAASFALYEIARRVGVLRFLLGMRGRPKFEAAVVGEPVTVPVTVPFRSQRGPSGEGPPAS